MVNVRPFTVSVYDRMVTLSSVFGVVMVGFFALFRRMTHAFVVVTWLVDEVMLDVIWPCVTKKPSTLRKLNAFSALARAALAGAQEDREAQHRDDVAEPGQPGELDRQPTRPRLAHGFAGSVSGRRMFG